MTVDGALMPMVQGSQHVDPPIHTLNEALAFHREIKGSAFAGSDGGPGVPGVSRWAAVVTSLGVRLRHGAGQVVGGPRGTAAVTGRVPVGASFQRPDARLDSPIVLRPLGRRVQGNDRSLVQVALSR